MLLVEIARRAVPDWSVETAGMWCRVEPAGCRPRGQGWKIHVSATPLSAPIVLACSVPVLAERQCAFKFAKSLEDVAELTGTRTVRSGAGKFLTAYPEDDEE